MKLSFLYKGLLYCTIELRRRTQLWEVALNVAPSNVSQKQWKLGTMFKVALTNQVPCRCLRLQFPLSTVDQKSPHYNYIWLQANLKNISRMNSIHLLSGLFIKKYLYYTIHLKSIYLLAYIYNPAFLHDGIHGGLHVVFRQSKH